MQKIHIKSCHDDEYIIMIFIENKFYAMKWRCVHLNDMVVDMDRQKHTKKITNNDSTWPSLIQAVN